MGEQKGRLPPRVKYTFQAALPHQPLGHFRPSLDVAALHALGMQLLGAVTEVIAVVEEKLPPLSHLVRNVVAGMGRHQRSRKGSDEKRRDMHGVAVLTDL